MADDEPSYIDYEAFLDPSFSTTSFANSLVLATNNPSDTPLDLSTPLSRVLFDVQEIDTHIDTLTTKSALPLLEYTKDHAESGERILQEVEAQVASLTEGYKTLEKEVIERYEAAEQLEAQLAEIGGYGAGSGKREDHRAMVRSSNTLVSLRQVLLASRPGEEGEGLERVNVIATLKGDLLGPAERNLISRSQQIIREFSMSSLLASNGTSQQPSAASTYAQTEDTKSRTTSALLTLYLLSPALRNATTATFEPALLISALQDYLQTSLKSQGSAASARQ
ncbi:Conserved oligomeric Golgi complex subunit 5 [Neofusicoccum parvum]|nr:Conserved oligomeric Golgi complex subunit 5 [Neofusicoccum parvum]